MVAPKISIIVPVYNVADYIAECLDSLVNQTLHDIEIICIDDCSTDASVEIIKKYAKQDTRIKLICKDKNSGQSDSRNIGISESSAPYIMFCDSDDWYAPDMCAKMLDAMLADDVDMCMCGTKIIYESNPELKQPDDAYFVLPRNGVCDMTVDIQDHCNVYIWNKIFKRSLLTEHNVTFPIGLKYEDMYFCNAYESWVNKVSFIADKLYYYRRRSNSTMGLTLDKTAPFAIDHIKIVIKYFEYLCEHKLYEKRYEHFWCANFIPMFDAAIRYVNNDKTCQKAFKMARKFIKENYKCGLLDRIDERTLCTIVSGTYKRSKKYLCGLIRINDYPDCKKVRFIGLPIYMVKYSNDCNKYYIFGVRCHTVHF